jgi:hypothetical protein
MSLSREARSPPRTSPEWSRCSSNRLRSCTRPMHWSCCRLRPTQSKALRPAASLGSSMLVQRSASCCADRVAREVIRTPCPADFKTHSKYPNDFGRAARTNRHPPLRRDASRYAQRLVIRSMSPASGTPASHTGARLEAATELGHARKQIAAAYLGPILGSRGREEEAAAPARGLTMSASDATDQL